MNNSFINSFEDNKEPHTIKIDAIIIVFVRLDKEKTINKKVDNKGIK